MLHKFELEITTLDISTKSSRKVTFAKNKIKSSLLRQQPNVTLFTTATYENAAIRKMLSLH